MDGAESLANSLVIAPPAASCVVILALASTFGELMPPTVVRSVVEILALT